MSASSQTLGGLPTPDICAATSVFTNQLRHYIRAVPANSHDQIYCERLGALAVDNALGGYTDFMISQWLTEFVVVPLSLVGTGQKGYSWKGYVLETGRKYHRATGVAGRALSADRQGSTQSPACRLSFGIAGLTRKIAAGYSLISTRAGESRLRVFWRARPPCVLA